jgi:hypothetical protein
MDCGLISEKSEGVFANNTERAVIVYVGVIVCSLLLYLVYILDFLLS